MKHKVNFYLLLNTTILNEFIKIFIKKKKMDNKECGKLFWQNLKSANNTQTHGIW